MGLAVQEAGGGCLKLAKTATAVKTNRGDMAEIGLAKTESAPGSDLRCSSFFFFLERLETENQPLPAFPFGFGFGFRHRHISIFPSLGPM